MVVVVGQQVLGGNTAGMLFFGDGPRIRRTALKEVILYIILKS